jgi:ribosomal protein L29
LITIMKKKELQDIKAKSPADLAKLVDSKRVEIDKAVLEIGVQKEKNLKKAKNAKKELAQLLTLIKEKELVEKETKK